jgi:hypothetical protein
VKLTDQQAAYAADITSVLECRGAAVLAGYAGTGKTVTAAAVVSTLRARGLEVAALAPTHRAAAVLGSRIGADAATVHSALGLRPVRQQDGSTALQGGGREVEADVLVVDEASMIGPSLWRYIQRAAEAKGLLLIGDPAQLSPVEDDGAPSPVWADVQRQFRLTKILRQDDGSQILPLSLRIREALESGGDVTLADLARYQSRDVVVVGGSVDDVGSWAADDALAGRDSLALGYTNAAVDRVNQCAHWRLGRSEIGEGDVVIVGRPYCPPQRMPDGRVERRPVLLNSARVLVEHDTGETGEAHTVPCRWLRVSGHDDLCPVPLDPERHRRRTKALRDKVRVLWAARDPEHASALALLGAWEDEILDLRLGYASTVHKAQGSTVDTAYLLWDDVCRQRVRSERLRLLYVAATRPSTRLAIVSAGA